MGSKRKWERWRPSLDWLLVFLPVSVVLRVWPGAGHPAALFFCAGLAIIPLAGWLGRGTEALAREVGQGLSGLLNATFGNAAELIIGIAALSQGLTGLVKASLTGSIIGNLLLVLGFSVAVGGTRYSRQEFDGTAARSAATALTLAAIGLLVPSVFHWTAARTPAGWSRGLEQRLSLAIAGVLFLTYLGTLLFSLRTHPQHFRGRGPGDEPEPRTRWSKRRSVAVMLGATVGVAWMSEWLVDTVAAAQAALGLSELFVGLVVVALIGNAAEHSTAVWMAWKNKMDLSLGIAVGSSLQVALFVAPVLVFVSYAVGRPMDLEFTVPEVMAVLVSVWIVSQISGDGESHWLEGVQLLALYVILALFFYFLPTPA